MIVLYIIFLLFLSTSVNCQVCPSGYVYSPSNGCKESSQSFISSGYCTLISGGSNTFTLGYEDKSPCDETQYITKTWKSVKITNNAISWYFCSSSDFNLIYYFQVGGCNSGDQEVNTILSYTFSSTNRYFVVTICNNIVNQFLFAETSSQPTSSQAVANQCALDYTGTIGGVVIYDYKTTLCPIGFTGVLPCTTDINECDIVGSCISPATCINTIGSYFCQCNVAGYRLGTDGKSCVEIDECAEGSSGCSNFCSNSPVGSFTCSCPSGYHLGTDSKTCIDIDECANGSSGCSYNCSNTPLGSYTCTCEYGYQLTRDLKTCVTNHYIKSIIPSLTTGGNASFYGEFASVHEEITLFIGDKECNITYVSIDLIICTAPPGIGIHSVNLTQNGLIYIGKNIYQYQTEIKECLNGCTSIKHGECITTTGQCKCNSGYTSYDCSIENLDGDPITNVTIGSGGTTLNNGEINFEIYFKSLLEIDINGAIIKEYILKSSNWISNKTNSNIVTFTQSFNQTTTNTFKISYIVEQVVGGDKEFSFAGTDFTISNGSVKFTITISDYTYSNVLNTLRLDLMSSVNELNDDDNCNSKDSTFNSNQLSEFNYFKFSKNSKEFFFRFINRALVDGRSTFIPITSNKYDTDSIIISLNLAHFTNDIIIDPDFSLLINHELKSECGKESSNEKKWLIPVAVVVPIVGLAMIIGAIIILRKNTTVKIGVAKLKSLKK